MWKIPDKTPEAIMKKILAFNGSVRKSGNTSHLLKHFLKGAKECSELVEEVFAHEMNLEYCRGCLRCNLVGRCTIHGDDWNEISQKILDADILVFATPVYFHHVSAPLKKVIDRFRAFVQVQITESGLKHTPWHTWDKDFVLLLSMGSSDTIDAAPIIELFEFFKTVLGTKNRLHTLSATRLAVINQILKTEEDLSELYDKMEVPVHLAHEDFQKNHELLEQAYKLGRSLSENL